MSSRDSSIASIAQTQHAGTRLLTGQAWGCRLPKPSSRPMAVRSRLRQTGSGHDSGLFFQSDGRRLKQPPELLNPHLTGPGLRPTPTVLKTAAI